MICVLSVMDVAVLMCAWFVHSVIDVIEYWSAKQSTHLCSMIMSIVTIAHLFLRFCNQRSMVKTNALGNTSHFIIFWANLSTLLLHKRLCNNGFHNGIFPMCSFLHSISVRGPRSIFVSSSSSSSWYFEAQSKRELSSFVAHRIDRMRRTFGWYFCCCVVFFFFLCFVVVREQSAMAKDPVRVLVTGAAGASFFPSLLSIVIASFFFSSFGFGFFVFHSVSCWGKNRIATKLRPLILLLLLLSWG